MTFSPFLLDQMSVPLGGNKITFEFILILHVLIFVVVKTFPHRHVGRGQCSVELQLQGLVPPIEGCDSLRPDGGDEVPVMELPVK